MNFIILIYSQSVILCSYVEPFVTTYSTVLSDFGNDEIHTSEKMKLGDLSLNQSTLHLFKTLTELQGASGNEHLVRNFMTHELEKYADQVIMIT